MYLWVQGHRWPLPHGCSHSLGLRAQRVTGQETGFPEGRQVTQELPGLSALSGEQP